MSQLKEIESGHTVLHVEEVPGGKVFAIGDLKICQLAPLDLGSCSEGAVINVYRDGGLFDRGHVWERHTSPPSFCFSGFKKTVPLKIRPESGDPYKLIPGDLRAEWFNAGDVLQIETDPEVLKGNIRRHTLTKKKTWRNSSRVIPWRKI